MEEQRGGGREKRRAKTTARRRNRSGIETGDKHGETYVLAGGLHRGLEAKAVRLGADHGEAQRAVVAVGAVHLAHDKVVDQAGVALANLREKRHRGRRG